MNRTQKLVVQPNFSAHYCGFYLQQLMRLYTTMEFSYHEFPEMKYPYQLHQILFRIEGETPLKVVIATEDSWKWNLEALEWCDIYAKINIDETVIPPEFAHKILPIGPSFSVKFANLVRSFQLALGTYLVDPSRISDKVAHFRNYYRPYHYRLTEQELIPEASYGNYIFFAATLYKNQPHTNEARARFIQTCRAIDGISFEGGFVYKPNQDTAVFENLTTTTGYHYSEYVSKTKRSTVVFNTPAVSYCHGWKLAEFLALGKAIISTTLTRMLPAPLIHGEHIHFVEPEVESIRAAVELLLGDKAYRQHLEHNARAYYDEHLRSDVVVNRILQHASILVN